MKIQYGMVPDPIDEKDIIYSFGAKPANMPSFEEGYDIEDDIGKVRGEYQGKSFACVAYGETSDEETMILHKTGQSVQLSQRDLYSQIYLPNGGSHPRTAYKLAHKKGVCEYSFMPTLKGDLKLTEARARWSGDRTPESIENALQWRIGAYSSMPSPDPDKLAYGIFVDKGVGGGYIQSGKMGHFVFHKGYGIQKGQHVIKYKDSYPPYDRWLVYKNRQWRLGFNGPAVQLYSHWVSSPGDWVKKDMTTRLQRKTGTKEVFLRLKNGERYWVKEAKDFNNLKDSQPIDKIEWKNIEEVESFDTSYNGKIIGSASFTDLLKTIFGKVQ